MKTHGFILGAALAVVLVLAGCGGGGGNGALPGSISRSAYTLRLPDIPPAWEALLGVPDWRIEWVSPAGSKATRVIRGNAAPEISLPETGTSPVSAWPCWPDRDIPPGVFRPAGALFPFDVSGADLRASWRGGVDAVLFWELAAATPPDSAPTVPRLPVNFNWPRFRELFAENGGINEAVRQDPWLADWTSIAQKTVQSGFDKRRLVPRSRGELAVPVGNGPWTGTSPFADALYFEAPPVFPVSDEAETWISAEGLLRCNQEAWLFLAWD
jgi:hypothetical protein